MARLDFNLLHVLDVLLDEGNVTHAARRLRLSPSAMSRALARLRLVTGDQLLVRAGRGLVPTPRAIAMREKARLLVEDASALLRPVDRLDLTTLKRTFTLRTSDGFVETFGPALIRRVHEEAPGVQLRFVRKLDKRSDGLRDGSVDLETGVVDDAISPEIRSHALFADRYIGVAHAHHPIVRTPITPAAYAACSHVIAWRQGLDLGRVDELLADLGLSRNIMTTVDGFSAALAIAQGTDLVATVPERHTAELREGMYSFTLPLPLRAFTISLLWHPRLDGDPAHRWLRKKLGETCAPRTI
ncbi:LysR family transcriptional regulator [Sphingosinicella rhizophila]|uniref:LysR family transcriptional regulator n=1 Tax=Sphingosinicella rhizophila TaxID=3050082 RepID=A0ABU3Q9U7_9SPHN|nr:LysR family transcriptional regulator [Sphingosinicella sp. GR2756]MDT9600185.1 LysR family transcriptional regulator [Sphingosinicella sp. GR2756]